VVSEQSNPNTVGMSYATIVGENTERTVAKLKIKTRGNGDENRKLPQRIGEVIDTTKYFHVVEFTTKHGKYRECFLLKDRGIRWLSLN